jgi:hypothetical protein
MMINERDVSEREWKPEWTRDRLPIVGTSLCGFSVTPDDFAVNMPKNVCYRARRQLQINPSIHLWPDDEFSTRVFLLIATLRL